MLTTANRYELEQELRLIFRENAAWSLTINQVVPGGALSMATLFAVLLLLQHLGLDGMIVFYWELFLSIC